MKFYILFLTSLITLCTYGMQVEDQLMAMRGKIRQKEQDHSALLQRYTKNKCRKDDQYAIMQKLFSAQWIKDCVELSSQIENSKNDLRKMDQEIEPLEKKYQDEFWK